MPLARRLRVSRFDPEATPLLATGQHIPHPVAAAATLDSRVKALACGRAKRAVAAPGSPPHGRHRCLPALGFAWCRRLRHSSLDFCHYELAGLAPSRAADCHLVQSPPAIIANLSKAASECNHIIQAGLSFEGYHAGCGLAVFRVYQGRAVEDSSALKY
jgi:hypothetical protein